uniref:Uncharacterized protein n=1 Tax=Tetranychus urticae TaxID=32264 RepID=T1KVH6_TETUR
MHSLPINLLKGVIQLELQYVHQFVWNNSNY